MNKEIETKYLYAMKQLRPFLARLGTSEDEDEESV